MNSSFQLTCFDFEVTQQRREIQNTFTHVSRPSDLSVFYHEHVLTKEPGTSKETPWHHDQSYYPVDGDDIVSLWIPADAVRQSNSVRFVEGSHRWGRWFVPRRFDSFQGYKHIVGGGAGRHLEDQRQYFPVPVSDIESGTWPLLSWDVEPGDCIAFHGRTLHGAKGNFSKSPRRVLSLRFVGPHATIAERPWLVSPPVWGGLLPGQRLQEAEGFFPTVWIADEGNE